MLQFKNTEVHYTLKGQKEAASSLTAILCHINEGAIQRGA